MATIDTADLQEVEDFIAEALDDSMDMDWTGRVGARAVMRAMLAEGVTVTRPPAVSDWWKPDPEDPFWMLESPEGEWLKNEHSCLFTREPGKALRFPSQWHADLKRRTLPHPHWMTLKPTQHLWISHGEREPAA